MSLSPSLLADARLLLPVAIGLTLGFAAGLLHFHLLRRTARAVAEGRVGLFLLQACLRFTVTGAALYLAGRWQAAALPAAALGIMAGRFVVLRPYRKSVP